MFKLIKGFFRLIWRTLNFLRLLIINSFLLIVVISLFVGISQLDKSEPGQPEPAALRLALDGVIVEERKRINPLNQFSDELLGRNELREIDINAYVLAIKQAAEDEQITGLVLEVDKLPGTSIAKLVTLGKAIEEFKLSGKPVVANGDFYDQHQYYLASYADQVNLHPSGGVFLRGFNVQRLFYKDALDKLSIEPEIFRVGSHKSFVEPYIRNDMSPEAKQDLNNWLAQLWDLFVEDIASNRQLSAGHVAPNEATVLARLREAKGNPAEYALRFGLVDQLLDRNQQREQLQAEFGEEDNAQGYSNIHIENYLSQVSYLNPNAQSKIAVIVAQGPIVAGKGDETVIAADSTLEKLQRVVEADDIAALVLRVDSPGGSAFAAELIRNKLSQIQQLGIPIIVSMGSTAASGGYWISADADYIYASPATITGSIGVFGMFASLEKALEQLGVHSDGVATSKLAQLSPLQPLPAEVKQVIQLGVEHTYQQFLDIVAEGRDIPVDQLDKIAQGRIWTGSDAVELGLADELGEMDQAIAYAANLVGLEEYEVKRVRSQLNQREQLIAQLFGAHMNTWFEQNFPWLHSAQQALPSVELFSDPMGKYSYCAVCNELD